MPQNQEEKHKYGLIGRNISYSFSRGYFADKFEKLDLQNHEYVNFDINTIEEFPEIIAENPNLKGLNVTIPYKEQIIPFLDELDVDAEKIGAVNTIKTTKNGRLVGFNTDVYGFKESLKPLLKKHHQKALILGTGGASKAIKFALETLKIEALFVSRLPAKEKEISYQELTEELLKEYKLIINCTPLGTFPDVEKCPDIPYNFVTNTHLLYDLIYNPPQTTFLIKGIEQGAVAKNGLEMLELQAEKAWKIWQ